MKGHGLLNREGYGLFVIRWICKDCANIHLKVEKFFTIGRPCIGVAEGVSALSWLYVHAVRR